MRSFFLLTLLALGSVQTVDAASSALTFSAYVTDVQSSACGGRTCTELRLRPRTREIGMEEIAVMLSPTDEIAAAERYSIGDTVLVESDIVAGRRVFYVVDRMRGGTLAFLGMLFAACVVLFAGRPGARSFLGLIASFLILFFGVIPSILAGGSPLLSAFAGSIAIMAATLIFGHGWSGKSLAALAGTAGSLLLTLVLAFGFTALARLTDLGDEESAMLIGQYPAIDPRGILLAGILIGTLGALDDITIAQASAVFELRLANAGLSARQLYRRALRIGADHIAAAVNTLVLAYAGAALPLLLLISAAPDAEPWWLLINREPFATEIIRTLVGSIGLLAAVPFTTWIASRLAVRMPSDQAAGRGHFHPH